MASAQDARFGQKDSSSDQNFDYMFKLLIIGNSSVGKTSFLFRYADDSFTSAFVSTVGIDFKVKTVFKNEKRIKLQIWALRLGSICFLSLPGDTTSHGARQSPAQILQRLLLSGLIMSPDFCDLCVASDSLLLRPITDLAKYIAFGEAAMSFHEQSNLMSTQIKTYSWDNAQVILVGNKCDMEDERIISTERGQHLGEQLGKTQLKKRKKVS
ncbi:Ras-related protein Rab-3C [Microtus ochrogaster]|uniref:small monomeric GTPase n=1 Tax=Microtus ochrogaster TaxID=79684 RepID=A0A8J6KMG9_MICOH|nr:Ras-related protein Rab-3C [Microtus ochrogaster]